jgi:hypothetical protein
MTATAGLDDFETLDLSIELMLSISAVTEQSA